MSIVTVPIYAVTFSVPEVPSRTFTEDGFEYNISSLPEVSLSITNAVQLCKLLAINVDVHAPVGIITAQQCCNHYNTLEKLVLKNVQPYVASCINAKLKELFLLAYHSKCPITFL
jgi:hypothetical protein